MRLALPTWVAAFVLTIAALVVPGAALAQVNGGVGFRVDQAPGSTMDAGYLTITAGAGETASGYFFMTNTARRAAEMRVYPADGLTGVTTGVVYGEAGDALAGAGAWITPDIRTFQLEGRSERRIDFGVRIPPGAESGDHVGAIVLEQNGRGSSTVTQIVRNVVPVRIIVPNGSAAQVMPRSAKITALPGTALPAVTVALRNAGSRMCAPTLTVNLRGPSEKGGEVVRQLDMILPGDRAPYPLPWPREIEAGSYIAKVVTKGCGSTQSISVTLDAPESLVPDSATTQTRNSGKTPSVVTDAAPGETIYRDGDGKDDDKKKNGLAKPGAGGDGSGGSGGDGSGVAGGNAGGGNGQNGAGGAGAGAGGSGGAGAGDGDPSWISKAAAAVAEHGPEVIKRATFPLLLLALVGLVFFVQEALDRKDPKLMLAPLHKDPDLPFDPDPLRRARVVPSPTVLRSDP